LRIGTQPSSIVHRPSSIVLVLVLVLDPEIFILFDEGAVIAALQAEEIIKCF
jgi:hypothetical protein